MERIEKDVQAAKNVFTGDKLKLASSKLIAADCIITSNERWALGKVYMVNGSLKTSHTGTTFGSVKPMVEFELEEERNISHFTKSNENDDAKLT